MTALVRELILAAVVVLSVWGCLRHWHTWGPWEPTQLDLVTYLSDIECTRRPTDGQKRRCRTCGLTEYARVRTVGR